MADYPRLKKVIWRFVRVFLDAFLVTFGGVLAILDGPKILGDAVAIGIREFFTSLWAIVFYPAILASIIAGIAALGKAVREMAGSNYDSLVHKSPVG